MIRVTPAPEPDDFDAKVRQPGLRALDELVGASPVRVKGGKKRAKIATTKDDIPAAKFPPYWRAALDDLLESYDRICAYLCLYIPRGTGAPSTDHMVPKSKRWDRVYEWDNYRLACSLINSRKGVAEEVLDPFEIDDGWFELELTGFQVLPSPGLPAHLTDQVEATITRLNDREFCEARAEYAQEYWEDHISLDYLVRHAPFVARELDRQGRLNPDDAVQ
ncbi:HNH endonuclease [Haliangium sp.]|uniref:HNH endonuclease n=1 Tax=Haliangium sp. TaxID=2663208 RepID=UPI003D0B6FCB